MKNLQIKRALIVDDERLARADLISNLAEYENIQVVGEACDVPSAVSAIQKLRPDVIFLDIQMPGESGFDLLEKVKIRAHIIFITAYDEFALRAFEVNALDYLLKPVHPARLQQALEKLDGKYYNRRDISRPLSYDDRLFLLFGDCYRFLQTCSILYVSAAGDYSYVATVDGQKELTQKTMKEWQERLPDQYFARIHRSKIVNLDYIEKMENWYNYAMRIFIRGVEEPFVISRRYVNLLKEKLK